MRVPRVGRPALALLVAFLALAISSAAHAATPCAWSNNATTFTCGSVSSNLATLGPLIWTSRVWGTGTWTFTR